MDRKKLILLVVIALLIGVFFAFDLGRFFTLESLKDNRDALFAAYQADRVLFIGSFVTVYVVSVALSLPGATILTLTGGAIFGGLVGTGAVLVGATVGATAAFLVARYLFRETLERKFGDRLATFNNGFNSNGLGYMLFLRLIPLFPFFLINLGAGLTRLPLRTYVIGTALGILPGTFVFANAGAQLARINEVADIASPRVLGSFVLLGLFALIPAVYRKVRGKKAAAPVMPSE